MPTPDPAAFEQAVRTAFGFLEEDGIARFRNTRSDDDPRDGGVTVYFENKTAQIRVAYWWNDRAVIVSLVLRRDALVRRDRGIYLDPWVRYVSGGRVKPVMPFFYPSMRGTTRLMREREELMRQGLSAVLATVAEELRTYYPDIVGASDENVRAYQAWYEAVRN